MANKITFEDKVQIEQITDYPEKNQCTADNLNEIKTVVNTNADETNEQKESIKQNTTDITKLQEENTKLKAQIPKGQASGEEINLQDSAEMELVDFGLQGNSKQDTREGYNLANYNTKITGKYNFNFEIGDITNGKAYTLYLYIPLGTLSFNLRYNTSDGNNILTDYNKTGKIVKTFTANQDGILYFNGFGESSDYNGIEQIMLLEGTYTTENLPTFEEYGVMPSLNYPSEIGAVGYNINIFDETLEKGGISYTTGNIEDATDRIRTTNYIKVNPNSDYILSRYYDGELNSLGIRGYDENFNYLGFIPITNQKSFQFKSITSADTSMPKPNTPFNYLKFIDLTNDLSVKYKLEEGTVATSYSSYNQGSVEIIKENNDKSITKNYTLPIQKPFYMLHFDGDVNISQKATVRDSFILKDGKWCEKHNIAKVNLEDINWYKGSAEAGTENTYKRWNSIAKYKDDKCGIAGSSNRLAISNYLANQYYKIFNVDKIGFNIENSEICIRFPISTANSPEEIKNFWQEKANEGNGAYILYPSKEPELTECTEEQVQVLEQIVKDGTYKGVTHFYTTQDLKPTIELTYYKDLETIINNQEQMQATLNNVQAQILELGG